MNTRILCQVCLCAGWLWAAIASAQATAPANPQEDRLTFLLFQLASDEQSIRAVNLALRQAGYRVAQEQTKVAQAEKGNELMDRNGGGPISYQDFYGKTARAYVMHDPYGSYHQVRRPPQFDYIYRANNEQADKAQREIDSLGQRVDALLARRTALENEQAALWLQIAFAPVDDRQIPYRPLYHFKLEAIGPVPGAQARLNIVRPAVLFLRIADRATAAASDSIAKDQPRVLASLDERIERAESSLENEMLQAKSEDNNPQDTSAADAILQIARRMKGQCRNAVDASRISQDENAHADDARKPMFRAQLQGAFIALAMSIADLDELISRTASDWHLQPQPKVPNPDNERVPDLSASVPADEQPRLTPPAPTAAPAASSVGSEQWVSLFNGKDTTGWTVRPGRAASDWRVENDILVASGGESFLLTTRNDYANFKLRAQAMVNEAGAGALLGRVRENRGLRAGNYAAYISAAGPDRTGSIYWTGPRGRTGPAVSVPHSDIRSGEWFTIELDCIDHHITVLVNGLKTAEHDDRNFARGAIGLEHRGAGSIIRFQKIEVQEVTGGATADTAQPAHATSREFTVEASHAAANAFDTGIHLSRGDSFVLIPNARDAWAKGAGSRKGKFADFKGYPDTNSPTGLTAGANWMAMKWRIGSSEAAVESGKILIAAESGELFLFCNDDKPDRNQGNIRVTVQDH